MLAEFYQTVDGDYPKAAALYKKLCDTRDYSRSCAFFGTCLLTGRGGKAPVSVLDDLSVCVCLSVCLSVCLCLGLGLYLCVCVSVCLSVSVCLPLCELKQCLPLSTSLDLSLCCYCWTTRDGTKPFKGVGVFREGV